MGLGLSGGAVLDRDARHCDLGYWLSLASGVALLGYCSFGVLGHGSRGRAAVVQAYEQTAQIAPLPGLIDEFFAANGYYPKDLEALQETAGTFPEAMAGASFYYRSFGSRYIIGLAGPWYAYYEYSSRRGSWNRLAWGW